MTQCGNYIELNGGACEDCVQAIANDEYSGMDDEQEAATRAGLERIGQYLIVGEEQREVWAACCVCGVVTEHQHVVGYFKDAEVATVA